MSVILHDDGSVSHRGGTQEEVFQQAAIKLVAEELADEKRDVIRRWLDSMAGRIDEDELEKAVEKEFTKRMAFGHREFKQLPEKLRQAVTTVVRELVRKEFKTGAKQE